MIYQNKTWNVVAQQTQTSKNEFAGLRHPLFRSKKRAEGTAYLKQYAAGKRRAHRAAGKGVTWNITGVMVRRNRLYKALQRP